VSQDNFKDICIIKVFAQNSSLFRFHKSAGKEPGEGQMYCRSVPSLPQLLWLMQLVKPDLVFSMPIISLYQWEKIINLFHLLIFIILFNKS
jgi:hypothetical protein